MTATVTSPPEVETPEASATPAPRKPVGVVATRERNEALIDLGAATVATVLAAIAFKPTFGGTIWLTTAVLGAVVAALAAGLCRWRSWSPLVTAAVAAAGLFLAGGISVPHDAIAGFLPGPSTPGAIFDGLTGGWARVLTTVAPVGDLDRLAAIVWGCAFAATFVAVTLARATRLSFVPALPALVVLLAGILTGTDQAGSVVLSGTVLMVVAVVWSTNRWRRRRHTLKLKGSSTDRQLLTSVLFVAAIGGVGLLLTPVLPFAHDNDRRVIRDETVPPFDPRDRTSPLTEYPHWRLRAHPGGAAKLDSRPVLVVKGLPKNMPVVLASLDIYDGSAWIVGGSPDASATGSSRFERVGADLSASRKGAAGHAVVAPGAPTTSVDLSITSKSLRTPWLPLPAGTTAIDFGGSRAETLFRDLRYNNATGTAALTGDLVPGDRYSVKAKVPKVAYAVGAARDALVGDAAVDTTLGLPSMNDPTNSLANRASSLAVGSTPYDRAVALEKTFRAKGSGYFSDGRSMKGEAQVQALAAGHTAGKLKEFLTQVAGAGSPVYIGNSEKFAAAMAVLARQIDLPARVVVGFREDANDKNLAKRQGDTVTFAADQYDAWVEIAFEGVGWVSFFPTPPRSNGTPPPPETTEPQVLNSEVQPRPPLVPPPNLDALSQDQKKDKTKQDEGLGDDGSFLPAWLVTTLKYVGSLLAIVLLVVGGVRGWKYWRRKRRRQSGTTLTQLDGAWREMADLLRDAGQPVAKVGTRKQVAAAIPTSEWDGAEVFAAQVDAAMFGPVDPSAEDASGVWDEVDVLREHLLSNRRGRDRFKFLMNPKTLWGWR